VNDLEQCAFFKDHCTRRRLQSLFPDSWPVIKEDIFGGVPSLKGSVSERSYSDCWCCAKKWPPHDKGTAGVYKVFRRDGVDLVAHACILLCGPATEKLGLESVAKIDLLNAASSSSRLKDLTNTNYGSPLTDCRALPSAKAKLGSVKVDHTEILVYCVVRGEIKASRLQLLRH